MLYFHYLLYYSGFLSLTLHHVWKNNGIMGGLLSVGIKRKGAVQYRQQQRMLLQNQESGGETSVFCELISRFNNAESISAENRLCG